MPLPAASPTESPTSTESLPAAARPDEWTGAIELCPAEPRTTAAERAELLTDPGFGRVFTDHMVTAHWDSRQGWHSARLTPRGPLAVDPACMGLHYGQSVFEGLKARRQPDGSTALFRPRANAERLRRSARRMAMPEPPTGLFLDALEALVRRDAAWVPQTPGHSLYLRPLYFASEPALGMRPADEYLFVLLASPVAGYATGRAAPGPLRAWAAEDMVRAAPGGTGDAKCAGNYGASLLAQALATAHGCDQVLWLDSAEHRWVEEMGVMNLFFVHGSGTAARLVTPPLSGTLLPGITRDSLLRLAHDLGYPVREERVLLDSWRTGSADGSLTEVFACGSAAGVTPVGEVRTRQGSWCTGDGAAGPVTRRLGEALAALQTGHAEDPYGWLHPVR